MNCILYARKSTASEDRQILSIEAQIKELKAVALNQGLNIVEVFSEAKSAKAPGRPIFNKMLKTLFESEGLGILCWKLDRLSRNPVDGGSLIWAIEQKRIAAIATPHRTFRNNGDDKFWMQLEFGMAKKYVDDLSDNVKRGLRAKLEMGILPGKAPLGYLNDRFTKTVVKDPDRFYLVRRIWDHLLSGQYSMASICETAANEWGLTIPQSKREGGNPLTLTGLYKLVSNPFYYGLIKRNGELYAGKHEPMISKEEFERVQMRLRRPTMRPKTKTFAFTGLIQCAECGSMITAEEKVNRFGSHYTYYRCTKKRGGLGNHCGQRYIRDDELERQIAGFLAKLDFPQKLLEWTFKQLEIAETSEKKANDQAMQALAKGKTDSQRKLDNLLQLKLKELLSDTEYLNEKNRIVEKIAQIERETVEASQKILSWLEPTKKFFLFAISAESSFAKADTLLKKKMLTAISSNLRLRDKKLLIEAKKPFRLLFECREIKLKYCLVNEVRTFFLDPQNHFDIPVLNKTK